MALDAAAGKLYVATYIMNTPLGYVIVYDTSSQRQIAAIGPFWQGSLPIGIAVDARAQRLYVLCGDSLPLQVLVYRLDIGFSFLEAFTAPSISQNIIVTPHAP